jgi:hypothetical protein
MILAPGQKLAHRLAVRAASVALADAGGEKSRNFARVAATMKAGGTCQRRDGQAGSCFLSAEM